MLNATRPAILAGLQPNEFVAPDDTPVKYVVTSYRFVGHFCFPWKIAISSSLSRRTR